jgi:hypothetical protein
LHDAIQLEQLGVPAAVVVTEPFQGLAANFAATLGMPGYSAIVVPHPIASKNEAWLAKLADQVADTASRALLGM